MLTAVFEPNGYFPSLYALPVFVTAALVLAFGVAVLFREHWSLESRLFFLNVLSVAIWLFSFSAMYCAKSDSAAFFWSKAAYLGVPFIPSCFYHFCVVVLKLGQEKMRLVRVSWLLSVFFAVTIIGTNALISSLYHYSWGYYPRYGWLSPIYLTFFFGMMIVTLRQYWLKMRQTDAATVFGRRARAFLAAFGIVYLGSVDYLPKFGIPIYPFGYIPVFVFLVLAGTAIWKYRLIDITPAFASERILETMHDALIVCDVKGTIRIANQAASRMFDYGPDELIGRSVESLAGIHAASREEVRTLLGKAGIKEKEFRLFSKFGSPVPVSLSISALVAPNSSVMVGYVIVVRDIGDHKRLENELRSLNEALERRVGERTEELEAKIEELQWLNEVMMHREERILELKEKIKGQVEDGHY